MPSCSDNAVEFLTHLGFRLDYEFAAKGTIFRKGRMKITVSKIFKIVQPEQFPGGPQPSTTVPATEGNLEPLSGSHLVELSVQTHSGDDAVAEGGGQVQAGLLRPQLRHRERQEDRAGCEVHLSAGSSHSKHQGRPLHPAHLASETT